MKTHAWPEISIQARYQLPFREAYKSDAKGREMNHAAYEWDVIASLPDDWGQLRRYDLKQVHRQWQEEKSILKDPEKIQKLHERLATEWAIETGIIERLYQIDRGVTETLIELGIESLAQFHQRGAISRAAGLLIQDQRSALEFIFAFVNQQRELSTSYIKELHQLFTRNQDFCEAIDQFGNKFQTKLLKGEWKKLPNNPQLPDGRLHEYCPPDFVQDEIDQLLRWYQDHKASQVDPEIEAAWLHHRFVQIHPFQDGNGRVSRALATLVFLQWDYLPLVIRDAEHRDAYINALERADNEDLAPLVNLFADIQVKDLSQAIGFLRTLRGEGVARIAITAAERAKIRQGETEEGARELTEKLVQQTLTRFEETRLELARQFENVGVQLDARVGQNAAYQETWWSSQIVEVAKRHDYWVNLDEFRPWVQLRLRLPEFGQSWTHFVVSFHHKGTAAGLIAANAFLSRSMGEGSEEGWEVIALTDHPYTYTASHREPEVGFRDWLEDAIEAALDRWQSQI